LYSYPFFQTSFLLLLQNTHDNLPLFFYHSIECLVHGK
jgi:hypothetical protein